MQGVSDPMTPYSVDGVSLLIISTHVMMLQRDPEVLVIFVLVGGPLPKTLSSLCLR